MVGGPVEVVVIAVLLDTAVATGEGATAVSAVAWPMMRRRKTNDSPDTRLAPIQKLRAEATECKACAKASGRLDV